MVMRGERNAKPAARLAPQARFCVEIDYANGSRGSQDLLPMGCEIPHTPFMTVSVCGRLIRRQAGRLLAPSVRPGWPFAGPRRLDLASRPHAAPGRLVTGADLGGNKRAERA